MTILILELTTKRTICSTTTFTTAKFNFLKRPTTEETLLTLNMENGFSVLSKALKYLVTAVFASSKQPTRVGKTGSLGPWSRVIACYNKP